MYFMWLCSLSTYNSCPSPLPDLAIGLSATALPPPLNRWCIYVHETNGVGFDVSGVPVALP